MNSAPDSQDLSSQSTTALHKRAEENLQYIRTSMESATLFTAVSGKGYVITGVSALAATWLAEQQSEPTRWLLVWMLELVVASSLILVMTAKKAANQGDYLWSASTKKLLFAFSPAMLVGGVLTVSYALQDNIAGLPGIWLSLYGAAVMTGGAYSVIALPMMGASFLLIGAVVLLSTVPAGLVMGLTMGFLHIVCGFWVWRNYGG